MTPSLPSASVSVTVPEPGSATGRRDRWCAGLLTWKGAALVYLFSLLNAIRSRTLGGTDKPWDDLWNMFTVQSIETMAEQLTIVLPVVIAVNLFPVPGRRQNLALATAVVLPSNMFWILQFVLDIDPDHPALLQVLDSFVRGEVRYGVLGGLFAVAYAWYRNEARSTEALHRTALAQAQLDAQMDEARLQVLQAQIEPHFLFNTLATVRRALPDRSCAPPAAMLDNLMRYLAVALPQMRANDSTLGREVGAGGGLPRISRRSGWGGVSRSSIAVPEALRAARMPPMMLITLVENAIKHGLNPLPEGGFVRIAARAESGRLEVEVADTGAGFAKSFGGGTGLANVRARLRTLYGAAGRLALSPNAPRGVTMTLTLPHVAAAPAGGPT